MLFEIYDHEPNASFWLQRGGRCGEVRLYCFSTFYRMNLIAIRFLLDFVAVLSPSSHDHDPQRCLDVVSW